MQWWKVSCNTWAFEQIILCKCLWSFPLCACTILYIYMCIYIEFLHVCLRLCLLVYSHCKRWGKENEKIFQKKLLREQKVMAILYSLVLLLKHSAIKPFSPTAPVTSIYCLLSSQCDIHDSLPIITNSTRRVHKCDKRAPEQPMRGWLYGTPQQRTTLKLLCCKKGGSARMEAEPKRDRHRDR